MSNEVLNNFTNFIQCKLLQILFTETIYLIQNYLKVKYMELSKMTLKKPSYYI
jgi:hypothetical protein